MRQQGIVIVNGGVSGNNNQVNNHNEFKQVNNSGDRNGKNDDPLAIGLGALAIMMVVVAAFLRHFEEIYFWLRIGALTGAALSILAWMALLRDDDAWSHIWPPLFGVAIGCVALWVLGKGYNMISLEMLQMARLPGTPVDVWLRFDHHDQRLITENLVAVTCLGIAIVFNILMGLHTLLITLARTEQNAWLASLANLMKAFRVKCGGIFAAFLVGVAYLAVSGVLYDLLHRAQ